MDLPGLQPIFELYIREGTRRLIALLSGEFFQGPLPKIHVVITGHVLHNVSLNEKLIVFRKAYSAVSSGGRVGSFMMP